MMDNVINKGILFISISFIVLAIFAPFFATFPPLTTGAGEAFLNPSFKHFLGTDNLGRDLYSELLYGARITLIVSFIAVITSTVVGVFLGAIAGMLNVIRAANRMQKENK